MKKLLFMGTYWRSHERADCEGCARLYKRMIGPPWQCLRNSYAGESSAILQVKRLCRTLTIIFDTRVIQAIREELS